MIRSAELGFNGVAPALNRRGLQLERCRTLAEPNFANAFGTVLTVFLIPWPCEGES